MTHVIIFINVQGDDALTYVNVGEAMGKTMAALMKDNEVSFWLKFGRE